jgi:hypothetical protein
MSWKNILKSSKEVYRNIHTGKQYKLVGYDMVPKDGTTHQVAIMVDDSGEKTRWEQRYIDSHFELVGEE